MENKLKPFENLSLIDLPNEIWKPIVGYEGLYEISNLGRLKSLKKNTPSIRKQNFDKKGYLISGLYKNYKEVKKKIHRLVAEAFISNPENKLEVNHKEGIKDDNRASELEWVTRVENRRHGFDKLNWVSAYKGKFGKLNHQSVKVNQLTLDGKFIRTWHSMADAEREYGFNHANIGRVCKGKQNQHKGFKWEYTTNKNKNGK